MKSQQDIDNLFSRKKKSSLPSIDSKSIPTSKLLQSDIDLNFISRESRLNDANRNVLSDISLRKIPQVQDTKSSNPFLFSNSQNSDDSLNSKNLSKLDNHSNKMITEKIHDKRRDSSAKKIMFNVFSDLTKIGRTKKKNLDNFDKNDKEASILKSNLISEYSFDSKSDHFPLSTKSKVSDLRNDQLSDSYDSGNSKNKNSKNHDNVMITKSYSTPKQKNIVDLKMQYQSASSASDDTPHIKNLDQNIISEKKSLDSYDYSHNNKTAQNAQIVVKNRKLMQINNGLADYCCYLKNQLFKQEQEFENKYNILLKKNEDLSSEIDVSKEMIKQLTADLSTKDDQVETLKTRMHELSLDNFNVNNSMISQKEELIADLIAHNQNLKLILENSSTQKYKLELQNLKEAKYKMVIKYKILESNLNDKVKLIDKIKEDLRQSKYDNQLLKQELQELHKQLSEDNILHNNLHDYQQNDYDLIPISSSEISTSVKLENSKINRNHYDHDYNKKLNLKSNAQHSNEYVRNIRNNYELTDHSAFEKNKYQFCSKRDGFIVEGELDDPKKYQYVWYDNQFVLRKLY